MASEKDKMLRGEYADFSDPELTAMTERARMLCFRLNSTPPVLADVREILEELIPGIPASSAIMPPFQCDRGVNIRLGENVFINYNCCFLDGAYVTVGDNTLIGPSVQIYTPQHPLDYVKRRKTIEKALAVTIGSDTWIGGGTVICPGVKIGDRCIIGAGSVVTADVPDDSLAAGNPAVVKRRLNGRKD